MVTELRFPSPGWKFYVQGIGLSALGIGFVVLGVVIVAVDPWNWAGVISMAGGILCAVLGVALVLFVWVAFIYGAIATWRDWKQFRRPTVVVGVAGVRFLASSGPVTVPWTAVEEFLLNRTLLPGSVVSKASLRLARSATADTALSGVPADRYLNVGLLSDLDVPEVEALRFLSDTAGDRLQIKETDRRTPSATHGYR